MPSSDTSFNIDIKARADVQALQTFNVSLVDLQRQLAQAKKDFANATPGSEQYNTAAVAVGALATRITAVMAPMRQYVEQQAAAAENTHRINAMLEAGINPWTTASASYRAAAQALQNEAAAARMATEEHERLNRAKAMQTRDMRADAVLNAQRQMAADLRASEAATAKMASAARLATAEQRKLNDETKKGNDEFKKTPRVLAPVQESGRNTGIAMLALSQAIDDVQYGFAGVLNNIPMLLMALGLGAGLTGVVSIAITAIYQLVKHLGDLGATSEQIGNVFVRMTPQDDMIKAQRKWEQAIKDVAIAYEHQRKAIADTQAAEDAKMAHDAKMAEIARRAKEIQSGRPQSAADFEKEQLDLLEKRKSNRGGQWVSASRNALTLEDEATALSGKAKEKAAEINGISQRFELDALIKQKEKAKRDALTQQLAELPTPDDAETALANEKKVSDLTAKHDAEIQAVRDQQKALPPLPTALTGKLPDDPEKKQALIDEVISSMRKQQQDLEDKARAKNDEAGDALAKTDALWKQNTLDDQSDTADTEVKIRAKKKEEAIARESYELQVAARKQPKRIKDDAVTGLEGAIKEAGVAGQRTDKQNLTKLLIELKKSADGLTPDLIVKINETLSEVAKHQKKGDTPATLKIKDSIAAARSYDEGIRGTEPPTPPNIEGVTPQPSAEQAQVSGTETAQENLYGLANKAEKAGNKKDATEARSIAGSLSDGTSDAEVDRLRALLEKLKNSKDQGVVTVAKSLSEYATASAAEINSVKTFAAITAQAQAALKFKQQ